MKILYIALKYDYGNKERGYSFEHNNFYDALKRIDNASHEIIYFPFDEIMQDVGRDQMNRRLIALVEKERPAFTFFCIFNDEIDKSTLKKIKESGRTITFNWFTDDHWRFDNFSKYWCWYFDYIGTTDSQAPSKYDSLGYRNVIKTQWACNHRLYKPTGAVSKFNYDITFVGQAHGSRKTIAAEMRQAGLPLQCFGAGWEGGRITHQKMLEIFSASKINLNLAASSDMFSIKALAKLFFYRRSDVSYNSRNPFLYQPYSPLRWFKNIKSLKNKSRTQIKGRNFEVPGTGGFLLTNDADNLRDYYEDGKEIVIFNDVTDLVKKASYYLTHEKERLAIAKAGYERTLKEHTYDHRFREIFKAVGLKTL